MMAGIIFALFALGRPPAVQWCVVVAWIVVLCLLGMAVDRRWRRFQSTLSEQSSEV
jgi:hypothetical protein